jgi:hypothetical protein
MKKKAKAENNTKINAPIRKKIEPVYTKASVDMDMPD